MKKDFLCPVSRRKASNTSEPYLQKIRSLQLSQRQTAPTTDAHLFFKISDCLSPGPDSLSLSLSLFLSPSLSFLYTHSLSHTLCQSSSFTPDFTEMYFIHFVFVSFLLTLNLLVQLQESSSSLPFPGLGHLKTEK